MYPLFHKHTHTHINTNTHVHTNTCPETIPQEIELCDIKVKIDAKQNKTHAEKKKEERIKSENITQGNKNGT